MGIPAVILRNESQNPRWWVGALVVALCFAIGAAIWFLFRDSDRDPSGFVAGMFHVLLWADIEPSLVSVTGGIMVITTTVWLATYGVMEVIHVKLGTDYHRVLLSIMSPADGRLKRTSMKLFQVPDIIEVEEVTLDPNIPSRFDIAIFKKTIRSVLFVGLVVSSYLFLNPVFLESIPLHEMMVIILLLSLFIPALVLPYIVTMNLRAKVVSKGNRPYEL